MAQNLKSADLYVVKLSSSAAVPHPHSFVRFVSLVFIKGSLDQSKC